MPNLEELSPDQKEIALITAALLHDIGKIFQRINKGNTHSVEGVKFLREIPLFSSNKTGKYVIDLVKNHHQQLDELKYLDQDKGFIELLKALKFGDTTSASHDREELENSENLKVLALRKIFDDININPEDKESSTETNYFYPSSLYNFIKDLKNNRGDILNFQIKKENIEDKYKTLSKDLEEIMKKYFENINEFDKNTVNTINTILMDKTRFVPAAFYYSEPTVPLYDHLKLTAALSLIKYRNDKNNKKSGIYIIGDLSGIQNYIFRYFKSESADDKASKRLRGRSYIINLITDAVVRYILEKLKLYDFNVLRSSAGGFLIISNFVEHSIIDEIFKNIENFFMDFRSLNITLAYKEFTYEEVSDQKRFQESFDSLINESLNLKKGKMYSDLDSEKLKNLFEIKKDGENICDFCGIRYTDNLIDNKYKCKICGQEEYIGDKVVKSNSIYSYIVKNKDNLDLSYLYPTNSFKIKFTDYTVNYLFDKDEISEDEISDIEKNQEIRVISIDNINYDDYFASLKNAKNKSYEFKFVSNNAPYKGTEKQNKSLKTFEEIANGSYLGVFKGDMDHLGTILSYGIDKLNLTKYSAFSYYMDLYYNVILNQIAKEKDVYMVFSGGDDISGVGNIENILEYIEEMQKSFNLWFKNERNITISVGITPIKDNYPLRQAIELAEEQLSISKKDKNRISVFDISTKWNEFSDSYKFSKKLVEKINKGKISKSFLYFLIDIDKHNVLKESNIRFNRRQIVPHPYIHYYIYRNYKEKDKQEFYEEIIKKQNLYNINLITHLGIILTKERENKNV